MKLVTYTYQNNQPYVGIVEDDTVYRTSFDVPMLDLIYRGVHPVKTSEHVPLAEVTLHAPYVPCKIIAIGRNYAKHVSEMGYKEAPEKPFLFTKLPSSVIGTGEAITWNTALTEKVDWEGELGVVIGKKCKAVSEEDALDKVFAYVVANDVSARDLQENENQWTRAKGLDTFCPLGPFLVTPDEIANPQALRVRTEVNGETMQDGNTAQMIHTIPALISYISQAFTLYPGDLILTGTPSGVGKGMKPPRFLKDGDVVRVTIDGLGTLENPCRVEG